MKRSAVLLSACLLVAATPAVARETPQQRGEAELAKELKGRVAGKPMRCLATTDITNSHIIDGTAIVYGGLGSRLWVNRPRGAEMLREDDIPVTYLYGSQLCSLDRVKLVDRTSRFERGFIGLGEFVPYTKPKTDR